MPHRGRRRARERKYTVYDGIDQAQATLDQVVKEFDPKLSFELNLDRVDASSFGRSRLYEIMPEGETIVTDAERLEP